MAIVQPIKDGQVVVDEAAAKKSSESDKSNTYDKEMFLKLLVAEMQYQDPLEPTSNTEYVAELASFSQIEAVQAVQQQMTTLEANSLVGKYVILLDGETYVSGKVDYVMTKDDEMFLSVNEKLYNINKLDSVCDAEYYNGVLGSQTFAEMINALPGVYTLTLQDEEKLTSARKYYDDMTDYQQQFVSADNVKTLESLEERMEVLKAASEALESQESEE